MVGDRVREAVDAKCSEDACARPSEPVGGKDDTELDRRLRALAGRTSRCRLIEGWLARDLLERRKWQPLGFARLGDYARERLGIGARCLEEEVRVARALRNLPRITSSFLDGELSWTTVRLLAGVASTQNETEWIEKARSLTSRALTALVRGTSPTQASAVVEDDEEDVPRRWSVRVSHAGRLLWRAASEVAQRMAGSSLTPAQVLELVAAEAATGSPATAARAVPEQKTCEEQFPPSEGNQSPAPDGEGSTPSASRNAHAGEAGYARSLYECVTEAIRRGGDRPLRFLTEDSARELEKSDPALAAFYLEEFRLDEGAAPGGSSPRRDDPTCTIADPAWFEKLLAELGEAEGFAWMARQAPASSPTDWLEAEFARLDAADPHTIDARLREVRRSLQGCEFELAELLREAADRRLYRSFHFANLELYVESRLGLSPRTAWSLLAVEKATRRSCPMLGQAWRDGRVSWLAARMLAPVVSAAHGNAWIERAQIVTLRRLEAEIAWAQNRRDKAGSFEYPAPPPLDLNLGDIVADTVTVVGLQMRAQVPEPDDLTEAYRSCVQIEFFAPQSVVGLAEDALLRLRSGSEPRGRVFERMLALAMLEWMSAPAHRDPVFARDGWRCAVPGCSSRRNLHDHHIVFRSHGGGNARDNRVTVCAAHHLHGLHRGRIRARGTAPHDIDWEIGCRFGGDGPLARTFGDRYV